ncbi:MAG: ATP-binding protein [Blastocatellia bacterium]
MAKVLVVDDELNIRWTMSQFLQRQGHDALSAGDYETAVGILDSERVDVAVVDVILPGKTGIDLLREINSRTDYIPVLVVTGEPNMSQMPEILRAGAYDFMPKPVLKDSLVKAVSRALERKLLVDQKRGLEERIRLYTEQLEALVDERTRELAEAHDFLNAVLDSSTEYAIVAADPAGKMTLFNKGAERLFGYPPRHAAGFDVKLLFADATAPMSLGQAFAEDLDDKGVYKGRFRFRTSEGSVFVGELAVTPILSADKNLEGYLHIIKDLTGELSKQKEMAEMQERLAATERIAVLGRVAAQIAHEVKNPLSGLRLYSLHLRSKISEEEPSQTALIQKIVSTIDHLSETVERVLNFARPLNVDFSWVDLNDVTTEAIVMLEDQMTSSQVKWDCSLASRPLFARVDKALIRSVLVNLILNSIQAMPEGGALTIRTGRLDRNLWVEVADTGRGMGADHVRNIFEPFFTTRTRGLGLGLYHARKVIDQHHGGIDVRSVEGNGTRVTISLPAED